MMRAMLLSAAFVAAAGAVSAQDPFTAAKKAAQNAAAATNAHIEAEQRPDAQPKSATKAQPQTATQPAKPAPSKSTVTPAGKTSSKTAGKPSSSLTPGKPIPANPVDTAGPPPSILREVFSYGREGRRDPFNSLMTTSELRPTMSDLRLTGVLFDPSNRRSGATLRDLSNNSQYRVNVGSTLGRMRVSSIRNKTVVFTIEEFGTTRQDSLVLGDSTKVRRP
jgi:hypothetical protein